MSKMNMTLSFVSSPKRGKLFVQGLLLNQRASPPLEGIEGWVNHKSCKLFVISTKGRNLKSSEIFKIFLDVSHSFDMTRKSSLLREDLGVCQ